MLALAVSKPQHFKWCLEKEIKYYDASNLPEKAARIEMEKGRKVKFTADFPELSDPPAAAVANAQEVLAAVKDYLIGNKFNFVNGPCGQENITDFATLPSALQIAHTVSITPCTRPCAISLPAPAALTDSALHETKQAPQHQPPAQYVNALPANASAPDSDPNHGNTDATTPQYYAPGSSSAPAYRSLPLPAGEPPATR